MGIEIVAAIGNRREIGAGGQIPWRGQLPGDLREFKRLTTGQIVIMGRKTFESMGNALPDRLNVVLSRNPNYNVPQGVMLAHSLGEALKLSPEGKRTFIIGGADVYDEALAYADVMHITFVDTTIPSADTFFPSWNIGEWRVVSEIPHPPTEKNRLNSTQVVYERRK